MKTNQNKLISSKIKITALIALVILGAVFAIKVSSTSNLVTSRNDGLKTAFPTLIAPTREIEDFPPFLKIQKQHPVSIQIDQVISYTDRYFVKGTIIQSDDSNGVLKSVDVNQMNLFDATDNGFAEGKNCLRQKLNIQLFN